MAAIPPPKNLAQLERRNVRLARLRQAMGPEQWDEVEFKRFKKYVQDAAQKINLDRQNRAERQDKDKWMEFIKNALLVFPDLDKYENYWPLEMYFNRWIDDRIRHQKRKMVQLSTGEASKPDSDSDSDEVVIPISRPSKRRVESSDDDDLAGSSAKGRSKEGASDPNSRDTVVPRAVEKRHKIFYIGKNPSNFRRPGSNSSSKQRSNSRSPVERSSDSDESDMNSGSRRRRVEQPTQIQRSPEPSGADQDAWPIWCIYCGVPPVVPASCTRELRQLFQGEPEVLAAFITIGILHDLHLRILATLDESQRRTFLLSFVPVRFSQFKACEISEMLDAYAKNHNGLKFPGGEIEICPRHQVQHTVEVPSELCMRLEILGMEELGPAAVFLGIDSNARFLAIRTTPTETKQKMVFEDMRGIKPSPFQVLMLKIAFAAPS